MLDYIFYLFFIFLYAYIIYDLHKKRKRNKINLCAKCDNKFDDKHKTKIGILFFCNTCAPGLKKNRKIMLAIMIPFMIVITIVIIRIVFSISSMKKQRFHVPTELSTGKIIRVVQEAPKITKDNNIMPFQLTYHTDLDCTATEEIKEEISEVFQDYKLKLENSDFKMAIISATDCCRNAPVHTYYFDRNDGGWDMSHTPSNN